MAHQTQQRSAIQKGFQQAGRPLSPQEVLDAAKAFVPSMGLATVYRHLKSLVDEGWLTVVELPGSNEPLRYEIAGLEHHHHFRCQTCDKVFDVPGCGVHAPHAPKGFVVDKHELWLYGTCQTCQSAPKIIVPQ